MKVVAIIGARMGSTRFPGKVLRELGYTKVLGWVYAAALAAPGVDEVIIATTTEERDTPIAEYASRLGAGFFRGSEWDVLDRYSRAAKHAGADAVVRLTGDCPFLNSRVIGEVIELFKRERVTYANNVDPPTYPDGLDVQIVTAAALHTAAAEATRPSDRDTVIEYISRQRTRWPSATLICPIPGLAEERWVLDTEEDYEFCKQVVRRGNGISLLGILNCLREHPHLRDINRRWKRNERFYELIGKERANDNPVQSNGADGSQNRG